MMLHDCVCVCDWLKWVTNNKALTLLFVTHFSQSQSHTQSCNIIGHLRTHSQSRNIIGHLCTHSSSHNTIGQCLLYNLSHTAVSLVLYAVDKGLRGRNVLQSLLLILLRICSRSVRPKTATLHKLNCECIILT